MEWRRKEWNGMELRKNKRNGASGLLKQEIVTSDEIADSTTEFRAAKSYLKTEKENIIPWSNCWKKELKAYMSAAADITT